VNTNRITKETLFDVMREHDYSFKKDRIKGEIDMAKDLWLFPIHFKSDVKKHIIIDKNRLRLRRITDEEILEIFGIQVTERTESGLIKSVSGRDLGLIFDPLSLILSNPNHRAFVISSQFILEAKDIECVNWFQQALKLYGGGKTGAYFGINSRKKTIRILHPIPYYGKTIYSLREDDLPKIVALYETIKNTKSKRYDLIIDKFLFAISGLSINPIHRFLELTTILEMLYLPTVGTELSFRFSLRVCKVFSKYLGMKEEKTYADMRKIYDIRSRISHSGFHKDAAKYLDELIDYTRRSIILFLNTPSIFDDKRLDDICVKN